MSKIIYDLIFVYFPLFLCRAKWKTPSDAGKYCQKAHLKNRNINILFNFGETISDLYL